MALLIVKIKTAFSLGLGNIARVIYYRLKNKFGLNSWRLVRQEPLVAPFFVENRQIHLPFLPTQDWQATALYFGWWSPRLSSYPPNWHLNPMNGRQSVVNKPWWKLEDFNQELGDIKLIWEASRFTWVLAFVEQYLAGDEQSLSKLNTWLMDWSLNNPSFCGVNWKCGQEASIRVMHLAMATIMLNQLELSQKSLLVLVQCHMQRIVQTFYYARSQDNNHATSEAAALFIGGSWLKKYGDQRGKHWEKIGRQWLEKLISRLIEQDGSFSQYSVNYHRVMLDTLSIVEIWRQKLELSAFSKDFLLKVRLATAWLANMVDPQTGDAPNIGAQDSAYLFPLGLVEHRDYRMSVQTAAVLFHQAQVYDDDGVWNNRIKAMRLSLPQNMIETHYPRIYDQGGYAVLRMNQAMAVLRYPRFRFRPSQSDLMHVDFWHAGVNLLRDAGTYSYHASPAEAAYFPGTASHNTIQFDERDQMPRLSRFLFGDWIKAKIIEPISVEQTHISFAVAYRDRQGAYHQRKLILFDNMLKVIDKIEGFKHHAVLRWRLMPAVWLIEGNRLVSEMGRVTVHATMPVLNMSLVRGWESRHYLQKSETPILEVEVNQAGQLITEYEWIL